MSHRPLLSLIVPTRQRTEPLTRLLDSLAATAVCADTIEVVLIVDEDDPASITLGHGCLPLSHPLRDRPAVDVRGRRGHQ